MLPPLFARQRRRLLSWTIPACAAAIALLLIALPPSLQAGGNGRLRASHSIASAVPGALAFPIVDVAHDPFVPEVRAALGASEAGKGTTVVRAIVLGESPKALVDIDGRTIVVGVGSSLGSAVVTAIAADAVLLDDGERLALDETGAGGVK